MSKKGISDRLNPALQRMKIEDPETWRQYRIQALTEKIESGYGQLKDKEELILLREKEVTSDEKQ